MIVWACWLGLLVLVWVLLMARGLGAVDCGWLGGYFGLGWRLVWWLVVRFCVLVIGCTFVFLFCGCVVLLGFVGGYGLVLGSCIVALCRLVWMWWFLLDLVGFLELVSFVCFVGWVVRFCGDCDCGLGLIGLLV